jgi:branched-chain amino acid transport system permease protein
VDLVLIAILGGSEVAIGAVAGSLILNLLPEALRFVGNWRLAAFGALLVLILLVRRQGLLDRSLYRMLGRIAGRGRG